MSHRSVPTHQQTQSTHTNTTREIHANTNKHTTNKIERRPEDEATEQATGGKTKEREREKIREQIHTHTERIEITTR
jgi:hypothetical protein